MDSVESVVDLVKNLIRFGIFYMVVGFLISILMGILAVLKEMNHRKIIREREEERRREEELRQREEERLEKELERKRRLEENNRRLTEMKRAQLERLERLRTNKTNLSSRNNIKRI